MPNDSNQEESTRVISARFSEAEVKELEAAKARLEQANEGVKFTLADVVRAGSLKFARTKPLAKAGPR